MFLFVFHFSTMVIITLVLINCFIYQFETKLDVVLIKTEGLCDQLTNGKRENMYKNVF